MDFYSSFLIRKQVILLLYVKIIIIILIDLIA